MLLNSDGHVKLTDFGLSRISMPEQEGDLNQNPKEMLKHLDDISRSYAASNVGVLTKGSGAANTTPIHTPGGTKSDSAKTKSILGTPDYLAPELLLGLTHGIAVDWWALGICIFEWLNGYPPFTADTPEMIFANILSHRIDWPQDDIGEASLDLIKQLLNHDPIYRFKADAVKQHNFFRDLDWKTIREQPAPFIPKPSDATDTSYFDGMFTFVLLMVSNRSR